MTEAQQGQILTFSIIGTIIGLSALSILVSNLSGTGDITQQAVRFIISIFMCISLYFGQGWARVVFAILLFVAGGFLIFLVATAPPANAALLAVIILVGGAYLVCAGLLVFSPSIRTFMRYQRRGLNLGYEEED